MLKCLNSVHYRQRRANIHTTEYTAADISTKKKEKERNSIKHEKSLILQSET